MAERLTEAIPPPPGRDSPASAEAPRLRPVSGAGMDRVVPRRRHARFVFPGIAMLIACALAALGWWSLPRGVAIDATGVRIAPVLRGELPDEVLLRATVMPLESVFLDATEGGRVEAIRAHDGQLVKRGELLFKLSNPQREQEVLARASDIAQQVANTATMRAELATVHADHRRRIADLEYQLEQQRKTYRRNVQLADKGFISSVTLEESRNSAEQQKRLLDEARIDIAAEEATRQKAIAQMDEALKGLNAGLAVVRAAVDRLAVTAPIDGRLSDFNLDVGSTIKTGDHLGRIDVPDRLKLVAPVDEFYLDRVGPGLAATASIAGRDVPLSLARVNTQVKDRRFEVKMKFADGVLPGLQPGQTIDTRLSLGKPAPAVFVPDGAFFSDTGGRWMYVLSKDGRHAERRAVRLGRRSAGHIEVLEGVAPGERVIVSSYAGFGDSPLLRLPSSSH